jgi:hypothetical protein
LALWLFASNYFALSKRVELVVAEKDVGKFTFNFQVLNYSVCSSIILLCVLLWIFYDLKLKNVIIVTLLILSLYVILSIVFLVIGLRKLVNTAKKIDYDFPVDNKMIVLNTVAYVLVVLVEIIEAFITTVN